MAAEILNKLRELQERNAYPMHMPGHKRVVDFIPFDSREFDYTEIEGLDNLHHPDGIIKTAQEQMAQLTGADASFMLVNGGSSGRRKFSRCRRYDSQPHCKKSSADSQKRHASGYENLS